MLTSEQRRKGERKERKGPIAVPRTRSRLMFPRAARQPLMSSCHLGRAAKPYRFSSHQMLDAVYESLIDLVLVHGMLRRISGCRLSWASTCANILQTYSASNGPKDHLCASLLSRWQRIWRQQTGMSTGTHMMDLFLFRIPLPLLTLLPCSLLNNNNVCI